MIDSTTLVAIATAFLAGVGVIGVLFTGLHLLATSSNRHIPPHQSLHQTYTALLFEFFELDAEIQVKLWESYSALLDSFLMPSPTVSDDELKKQTEGRLKALEPLVLKRTQSLTKCASLLPAEMYSAAQELYDTRGRMLSVLWNANYENKSHTLRVALILYRNAFKARNTLISITRQLLGVDKLTVDVKELWGSRDSHLAFDIAPKLKEAVLRRKMEKDLPRKVEMHGQAMKEDNSTTIAEAPIYALSENIIGSVVTNSEQQHDVA